MHTNLARRFGCNLYLARLEDHGVKRNDVFMKLNADNYLVSAKRALAIASQLGDSVLVVGTSAGGMLGLYLTSVQPRVAALVLYSPAVALFDPAAVLLDKPWGLQIARRVYGSEYSENRKATAAIPPSAGGRCRGVRNTGDLRSRSARSEHWVISGSGPPTAG